MPDKISSNAGMTLVEIIVSMSIFMSVFFLFGKFSETDKKIKKNAYIRYHTHYSLVGMKSFLIALSKKQVLDLILNGNKDSKEFMLDTTKIKWLSLWNNEDSSITNTAIYLECHSQSQKLHCPHVSNLNNKKIIFKVSLSYASASKQKKTRSQHKSLSFSREFGGQYE